MSTDTQTSSESGGSVMDFLRKDTTGGLFLLIAMVLALVLANSPWSDFYFGLRDAEVGPGEVAGLQHTVGHWAADGLLAVFFFLTGLELKAEFVDGELHNIRKAILPVVAAAGGVLVPALIFLGVNLASGGEPTALHGWAIPTATDIAFAVSVLAVVGSSLPVAMRTFLLTLAVVDDLIAIAIIAFVYTESVKFPFLIGAAVLLALFWFLTHKYMTWFMDKHWAAWVILLPIGLVTWWLVYESGIHATIAGVLLGFMVPVLKEKPRIIREEDPRLGLAPTLEHRFRPLSNGVIIPVFAFFSAGVAVGGLSGIKDAAMDPVALGIVAGLVLGKPLGIFGAAWLMDRFTSAEKDKDYTWLDMLGMTFVAGIGFTVSLLVAELSFGEGSPHSDHAKVGILCGSLLAAAIGAAFMAPRNAKYKAMRAAGNDPDTLD
ncbi:MAG: Na+/H+ antiporter NhaA [Kocuria sp.]|uniref:Na(+)/H(+) antiporter NhaA n=2 Tax=Kocuria salsicia TaxID=664639 RepID=A0ABV3KBJ7_9MICC|nr:MULTISPECIES: Na+/H+ antiporter NhaA [Kocuria]MDO4256903.1 Na+/H+ antiporter NhaA [Kocuria sp.]